MTIQAITTDKAPRYIVARLYVPHVPGGWGVIDRVAGELVWYQQRSRREEAEAWIDAVNRGEGRVVSR